ncbi:MAG: GGDEF domain-containing phosphodiesterase [Betaproteobacteria bacterium]
MSSLQGSAGEVQASQEIDRKLLRTTLNNAIIHARMAQRVVAILIVSLSRADRLDAILGVPARQIMQLAMRRVTGALRPDDRIVQLTDDKICVMLPNLRSEALPLLAAGKIQQALEAPFSFEESVVTIRSTIGIASFPAQAANGEELLVHADIAKDVARNREILHYVFHADDRRAADTYTGLGNELREAIRTNQLEVHYQPKVDLKSGQCHSVEALLRWTLPDHGAIPPPSIIRVAEANGMIAVLTEWVLNTSLRHQSEWKHLGTNIDVAVNLSTITLGDGQLPGMIGQALGTWQADPAHLTLEITEDATINDMEYSLMIMNQLKEMGTKLSVDDFGTGYSSLSYVKRFPLNELKIDKLFIQHMRDNKGDQQIVRSVIDLAHNFDLTVVAEGVEDNATLKELKRMGCDLAQGFVLSPAIPAGALREWLKRHN